MRPTPASARRTSALVYGAAFVLVLVAAATLFLGLVDESARVLVGSIVASFGALVLLATGIVRSSGPPKADIRD